MHICKMFQKLQNKWKVSGWRLLLILITFATGGSLCGYAGRKILQFTNLEKGVLWVILYIILVTLIWPLCVLLISIPLGQFVFFRKYISKLFSRMSGKKQPNSSRKNNDLIQKIAVFASGGGSNADKIMSYFKQHSSIEVALLVCNKPNAGVIDVANRHQIPVLLIDKAVFFEGDAYVHALEKESIDWIVLAGFLWKVPVQLIKAYPQHIINIHPALLPNYGGKGMYGHHVHEAVSAAQEVETGISIHFVDELYDHGAVIAQEKCAITAGEDPAIIASKVLALEHLHYPKVIERVILEN